MRCGCVSTANCATGSRVSAAGPTFDDGAPLLEVFLFDFTGELYGKVIEVAFIGWIRPEQKFASVEALMQQMEADAAKARDALARAGGAFPVLGTI